MSLGHQAPEQRIAVAFARTMFIIAVVTLLGWLFSKPEGASESKGDSTAVDGGAKRIEDPQ